MKDFLKGLILLPLAGFLLGTVLSYTVFLMNNEEPDRAFVLTAGAVFAGVMLLLFLTVVVIKRLENGTWF